MSTDKERELLDLQQVFECAFDEIFVTDEKGIVVRVNSACEEHYQLSAREIIGRHVEELQKEGIFYPSATLEVIEKKAPIELVQTTKSGRYLHVRTRPVMDETGELKRVISYSKDLTELYDLREKVEKISEQLNNYKRELQETVEHEGFIYKSSVMKNIFSTIEKVAKVNTTVLVLGETGVGKSRIVKMIHEWSERKNEAFYELNCAALPHSLIESELFGYERGSFTGANQNGKKGILELANKGTLFLDEIGELPLDLQAKLLQVIQEKKFRSVGGGHIKQVDIRIIAATNRNLKEMVDNGLFRKDLYYRLNVVPIYIPPLRERSEDILPLIDYFLKQFNSQYGRSVQLSPAALAVLVQHPWDGNIREVENVIERLVITGDDLIKVEDLPIAVQQSSFEGKSLYEMLQEVEKKIIIKAYKTFQSSYKVAKHLRISQSAATRKIKKYVEDQKGDGSRNEEGAISF